MSSDRLCGVCRNPRDGHDRFRHPFTESADAPGYLFKRGKREEDKPRESPPFDPVLRKLLIEKNVITVEELSAATLRELTGYADPPGGAEEHRPQQG